MVVEEEIVDVTWIVKIWVEVAETREEDVEVVLEEDPVYINLVVPVVLYKDVSEDESVEVSVVVSVLVSVEVSVVSEVVSVVESVEVSVEVSVVGSVFASVVVSVDV